MILIALDFSKAYDTVHHSVFVEKPALLEISNNIFNWLTDFLQDRKHATETSKWTDTSNVVTINASIVQGSGVGPSAYDSNTSD